jgi:hypothetical protein
VCAAKTPIVDNKEAQNINGEKLGSFREKDYRYGGQQSGQKEFLLLEQRVAAPLELRSRNVRTRSRCVIFAGTTNFLEPLQKINPINLSWAVVEQVE